MKCASKQDEIISSSQNFLKGKNVNKAGKIPTLPKRRDCQQSVSRLICGLVHISELRLPPARRSVLTERLPGGPTGPLLCAERRFHPGGGGREAGAPPDWKYLRTRGFVHGTGPRFLRSGRLSSRLICEKTPFFGKDFVYFP